MPSSPRSPTHRRYPSSIDMSPVANYNPSMHSRRQSKDSIPIPITPSRHSRSDSGLVDLAIFRSGGSPPGCGLGNLADELADMWDDEDGDEYPDMNFQKAPPNVETTRDSGVDVTGSPAHGASSPRTLMLPKNGRGHRRPESDYDGSDYGNDSDMDSAGMPLGLIAKMDAIEALARRGTESNGTDRDGVIQRVADELRELGSQSTIENGTTRLITAHTALSMHVQRQTRVFYSLTSSLLSPLSPPHPDFIDEILPLLTSILESIPSPTTAALSSLTALHSLTADVLSTLSYISDTLHMSRQTTITATRLLKNSKELVAEMRREDEAREEGERWLSKGKWGERIEARECAGICREVMDGFEEVCNNLRATLKAQAEAVDT